MKRFAIVAAGALAATSLVCADAATLPSRSPALVRAGLRPASTTGWVDTKTAAMPLVRNVALLGPMSPTQQLSITVGLAVNRAAADTYLRHISTLGDPLYRQFLTPAQFTSTYAPSSSAASAVANYLASAGLTAITIAPNRAMITATGTVAAIEHAFNTQINMYSSNGTTFFANAATAQVPASLGSTVDAVLGIDSLGTMRSFAHHKTVSGVNGGSQVAATGAPGDSTTCSSVPPAGLYINQAFFTQFGLPVPPVTGVTFPNLPVTLPSQVSNFCLLATLGPLGYQRVYDAAGTPTAQNTPIAILAEGKIYPQVVPNDLRTFEKINHLAQVSYTIVPTSPSSTLTDTSGQDEFDMDTQYSTGMAGYVPRLYVYDTASLSDADLASEINRWATDNLAKTASLSVGGCEVIEAATGGTELIDNALVEAAVQGQSLFVSSGDEGSGCALVANTGTPVGVQSVEYPASSTYAVAVGGTSLIPDKNVNYNYEVSWVGGGGGISYVEPAPIWQYNYGVPSAQGDKRGVPDIAMPADPNFGGAHVIVNGQDSGVGGTSLAAPLSNGVWARLLSTHRNALGFAPPALYATGTAFGKQGAVNPAYTSSLYGGFHDIYLGSNGVYQATLGWDYNTGLGSFDVAKMQSAIK